MCVCVYENDIKHKTIKRSWFRGRCSERALTEITSNQQKKTTTTQQQRKKINKKKSSSENWMFALRVRLFILVAPTQNKNV